MPSMCFRASQLIKRGFVRLYIKLSVLILELKFSCTLGNQVFRLYLDSDSVLTTTKDMVSSKHSLKKKKIKHNLAFVYNKVTEKVWVAQWTKTQCSLHGYSQWALSKGRGFHNLLNMLSVRSWMSTLVVIKTYDTAESLMSRCFHVP